MLRARYEQAQAAKAEKARAAALHTARCSVSRKLARPVEKILALYNGPQEDWFVPARPPARLSLPVSHTFAHPLLC